MLNVVLGVAGLQDEVLQICQKALTLQACQASKDAGFGISRFVLAAETEMDESFRRYACPHSPRHFRF